MTKKNLNKLAMFILLGNAFLSSCATTPSGETLNSTISIKQIQPFDKQIKNNALTINSNETLAIASNSDESQVRVYDLTNKKLIHKLTYVTPRHLQFAADGNSFYISDSSLGIIQQVSTIDFSIIHQAYVGQGAFGFTLNKDYLLINNEAQNTVTVINLANWKIERVLNGFQEPRQGIKFGPDNRYVYVTNFKSDDVRVIDTRIWQIVKTLTEILGVRAIAISPDESLLYGASSATNSLRVIKISNNQLLKTLPTGNDPYGASLSKDGDTLITGNKIDGTVEIFSTKNYQLLKVILGFNEPRQAILYSKSLGKIYVLQKDMSIGVVNYLQKQPQIEVIN